MRISNLPKKPVLLINTSRSYVPDDHHSHGSSKTTHNFVIAKNQVGCSKCHANCPEEGKWVLENMKLKTAMGLSGAAIAIQLGVHTENWPYLARKSLEFLINFYNAGLGAWKQFKQVEPPPSTENDKKMSLKHYYDFWVMAIFGVILGGFFPWLHILLSNQMALQ